MTRLEIEVRLLHPNLGQERGETVVMELSEARRWIARRLAVPVDEDELAAHVEAAQSATAEAAEPTPPPRPHRGKLPSIKPVTPRR